MNSLLPLSCRKSNHNIALSNHCCNSFQNGHPIRPSLMNLPYKKNGNGQSVNTISQKISLLLCIANSPGLADNGNFHLTGIGHLILDFTGNLEGKLVGLLIGNLFAANNYP